MLPHLVLLPACWNKKHLWMFGFWCASMTVVEMIIKSTSKACPWFLKCKPCTRSHFEAPCPVLLPQSFPLWRWRGWTDSHRQSDSLFQFNRMTVKSILCGIEIKTCEKEARVKEKAAWGEGISLGTWEGYFNKVSFDLPCLCQERSWYKRLRKIRGGVWQREKAAAILSLPLSLCFVFGVVHPWIKRWFDVIPGQTLMGLYYSKQCVQYVISTLAILPRQCSLPLRYSCLFWLQGPVTMFFPSASNTLLFLETPTWSCITVLDQQQRQNNSFTQRRGCKMWFVHIFAGK